MKNEISAKEENSNCAGPIFASACSRIGIIATVTLAGAIWLNIKGPIPIIKGSIPLPEMVPSWYMLLAFPILGMLVSDFIALLFGYRPKFESAELLIQIMILTILSNIRLSAMIPLSGHTLLLGYFILRRILIGHRFSGIDKIELLTAFIILLVVSYFKLVRWSDPLTYFAGLGLGTVLAFVSFLFQRYNLRRAIIVRSQRGRMA